MMLKLTIKLFCIFGLFVFFAACEKDDAIEYQAGYPNKLAGNWVAFQFQGGDFDGALQSPYDLVTALDPNRDTSLILHNLYNSSIRTRVAMIDDTSFTVQNGGQLDQITSSDFGVENVNLFGFVNQNPVLINFAYRLAQASFSDMNFKEDAIEDVIFIRAGFRDQENALVDTVLIFGYRKTGFEEVGF